MALGAILDVDGTLVDTNYHHAIAWYRALREHGKIVSTYSLHRHMGMGGDNLVAAVAGEDFEDEKGDDVRATEKERYKELIDEVELLPGARELIVELKERGHVVVLASSAKEEELEHYLDLLDARELAHDWTTSADVDATKPEPDLVQAAIDKAGDVDGYVLVGDSKWDCEAAQRAEIPTLAVLTGGFSPEELRDAGAEAVYESPEDMLAELDETAFTSLEGRPPAMERIDESDQLPEDGPPEEVPDDSPGASRDEATENPGGADEPDPEQATGHPENAG